MYSSSTCQGLEKMSRSRLEHKIEGLDLGPERVRATERGYRRCVVLGPKAREGAHKIM